MKHNALKAAFPYTIPVLLGYIFLGIAFGILLSSQGYPYWLAILMSLCIYAGSMQFVAINLLTGGAGLLSAAAMTLMVNARHLFYGLSMLEKFRTMKHKKPYMIFSLTDETYSLLCGLTPPLRCGFKLVLLFYCPAQSGLLGHRLRRRSPGRFSHNF